jgi:peptidoglycan hydrolase CwlO-like protein
MIFVFLLMFSISQLSSSYLYAQESEVQDSATNRRGELQKQIQEYESKLADVRSQKNTLSAQINYMDTQIALASLRMEQTEQKILDTEKEINVLGVRISSLDSSLDQLSETLLQRIVAGYKNRNATLTDIVLDSINATKLVNRLKYYDLARDRNQKALLQVQEAKSNFEEQKTLRERKAEQLEDLKQQLTAQQVSLSNQQEARKQLLAATQNDEKRYQSLLEQAKQELAGYSSFALSAGGASLRSFGSGSNGWFYTQRDPAWGSRLLPGSSSSVALAGCALTSVAMVCSSYGQSVTPLSMVSDTSKFIYGDMWNWAFGCSGKQTSWDYSLSKDKVKSYVENGTPVIIRLVAPSVSGIHFVVAFDWDEGSNDAIIHDPYYGPDKKFTDVYAWSQVTRGIIIR